MIVGTLGGFSGIRGLMATLIKYSNCVKLDLVQFEKHPKYIDLTRQQEKMADAFYVLTLQCISVAFSVK